MAAGPGRHDWSGPARRGLTRRAARAAGPLVHLVQQELDTRLRCITCPSVALGYARATLGQVMPIEQQLGCTSPRLH